MEGLPFAPDKNEAFAFDITNVDATAPEPAVLWGGREVLDRNDITLRHRNYPYAFIKYTVRGSGILRLGSRRMAIEPGMVFWSCPNHHTILKRTGVEPMVNYVVMLTGSRILPLFDRHLHEAVGAAQLDSPFEIESIMHAIMVEGLGRSDYRRENCTDLARVLLRRVESNLRSTTRTQQLSHQTFWECKQFIESRFTKIFSLNEIARLCGITPNYICRLFDAFDTVSPYEYLGHLKFSEAERLIVSTSLSVKNVAEAVGYKDIHQFSRNFKKHFGLSPTQYRKLHT